MPLHQQVDRPLEPLRVERPDGLLASLGGQTGLNLAMDLVRNGVLVGLEGHGMAASQALHQGIGLIVLAAVCAAVVAVMRRPS